MAVLRHGRLHRYNTVAGEVAETALLEEEFAAYVGAKYCLALASGGAAMACALRALQVKPGDPVLSNAFTLAPVPGAIASLGARPVFVEVTEDLTIDLGASGGAGQGHRGAGAAAEPHAGPCRRHGGADRLCDRLGLRVIEDCAHTMGARWKGVASGRHGAMGCYSTQTYKHMNSGEGGIAGHG
jgi:dTDP-4-amino-4,6-dideoxygalactose transaminase